MILLPITMLAHGLVALYVTRPGNAKRVAEVVNVEYVLEGGRYTEALENMMLVPLVAEVALVAHAMEVVTALHVAV